MTVGVPDPRIIVALDNMAPEAAVTLARQLPADRCRLKVGKELFTRAGPSLVQTLHTLGFGVFLDLKFHDIPNTVAQACRAAADLGVWMVNVHALGGRRMLAAARESLGQGAQRPLLTAVTVLTSHSPDELAEIGLAGTPEENVARLARLAQEAGLDGVVCSAQEAPALRTQCGRDFLLVTPGIRPAGSDAGDQRRVVTPADALARGASYLVIGRPITAADDPLRTLLTICADVDGISP